MTQITIEIKDSKTLKLIEDLEALNLIKVVSGKVKGKRKKLSDRLAGSLSQAQAKKLDNELKEIRNEWERGI